MRPSRTTKAPTIGFGLVHPRALAARRRARRMYVGSDIDGRLSLMRREGVNEKGGCGSAGPPPRPPPPAGRGGRRMYVGSDIDGRLSLMRREGVNEKGGCGSAGARLHGTPTTVRGTAGPGRERS